MPAKSGTSRRPRSTPPEQPVGGRVRYRARQRAARSAPAALPEQPVLERVPGGQPGRIGPDVVVVHGRHAPRVLVPERAQPDPVALDRRHREPSGGRLHRLARQQPSRPHLLGAGSTRGGTGPRDRVRRDPEPGLPRPPAGRRSSPGGRARGPPAHRSRRRGHTPCAPRRSSGRGPGGPDARRTTARPRRRPRGAGRRDRRSPRRARPPRSCAVPAAELLVAPPEERPGVLLGVVPAARSSSGPSPGPWTARRSRRCRPG